MILFEGYYNCKDSNYLNFIMKFMHVCAAQKAYNFFTKLKIKHDFPSLADEIAKPRLDMNIKLLPLQEANEKSINTRFLETKLKSLFQLKLLALKGINYILFNSLHDGYFSCFC